MRYHILIITAVLIVPLCLLSTSPAQEGAVEKIGRQIDQGLNRISEGVQEAWIDVRARVDKLGVQGRVYGRLRWEKTLAEEPIQVDVEGKDIIVLSGRVPDEKARQKALDLAKDTVGVESVIDRLRIEPRRIIDPPAAK